MAGRSCRDFLLYSCPESKFSAMYQEPFPSIICWHCISGDLFSFMNSCREKHWYVQKWMTLNRLKQVGNILDLGFPGLAVMEVQLSECPLRGPAAPFNSLQLLHLETCHTHVSSSGPVSFQVMTESRGWLERDHSCQMWGSPNERSWLCAPIGLGEAFSEPHFRLRVLTQSLLLPMCLSQVSDPTRKVLCLNLLPLPFCLHCHYSEEEVICQVLFSWHLLLRGRKLKTWVTPGLDNNIQAKREKQEWVKSLS